MLKNEPSPAPSRMARNMFDDLLNSCSMRSAVMIRFPNIIPARRPDLSESHSAEKKAAMEPRD